MTPNTKNLTFVILLLVIAIMGIIGILVMQQQKQIGYTPITVVPTTTTATSPTPTTKPTPTTLRITTPVAGANVASPVSVSGEATGSWFFEAEFTAKVLDSAGRELGQGIMTAQGEWMTESFVPFTGSITFTSPTIGITPPTGELRFEKANPSGLAENDESFGIPITFSND